MKKFVFVLAAAGLMSANAFANGVDLREEGKCAVARPTGSMSYQNAILSAAAELAAKGYKVVNFVMRDTEIYVLGCK
ncbi:hypothetical protein ACUH78_18760 [Thauera sp. ZXT1-4]|uniref:hypothetical protein n=1 Tax=Thauera sp. ZXT1-4 TaxID=3460294 RepID=UPI0040409112